MLCRSKFACRPNRSSIGDHSSYRSPRLMVSLGLTFQSSCAYHAQADFCDDTKLVVEILALSSCPEQRRSDRIACDSIDRRARGPLGRERERRFVLAVTDVPVRIRYLEEREFDRPELRAELYRVRTLAQRHVLDEVPDVVVLLGWNPVVRACLRVAVAEADLRQPAVVRRGRRRIVPADAELCEQVGARGFRRCAMLPAA